MERELKRVVREARARGLSPFEIFREAKVWIDNRRLELRGLVSSLELRANAIDKEREEKAQKSIARPKLDAAAARRKERVNVNLPRSTPREIRDGADRAPAGRGEDSGEEPGDGVGRDLRWAKGVHSHLLELRRAAIDRIVGGEKGRVRNSAAGRRG